MRASRRQLDELLEWAVPFATRTWAIESAGGLGYLLAQQLVAAGDAVLDVPATLAAWVRVLGTGRSNKNDPNDARSVAIAALRAPQLASFKHADHAGVLRLLAKRNNDLGRARNRTECRLHALLAELVAGGIPNEINASSAERLLGGVRPASPVEVARHARPSSTSMVCAASMTKYAFRSSASRSRSARQARRSPTSSESDRSSPRMLIGYTGDVTRFTSRDRFAAYTGTAPIEVFSGGRMTHRLSRRGNRQLNHAIHIAAITQIRFAHSPGRAFFDRKIAEGKSQEGSGACAQAAHQRRHLPTARHRCSRNGDGSGRATGATLESSVAGSTPRRPALRISHSLDPTQR